MITGSNKHMAETLYEVQRKQDQMGIPRHPRQYEVPNSIDEVYAEPDNWCSVTYDSDAEEFVVVVNEYRLGATGTDAWYDGGSMRIFDEKTWRFSKPASTTPVWLCLQENGELDEDAGNYEAWAIRWVGGTATAADTATSDDEVDSGNMKLCLFYMRADGTPYYGVPDDANYALAKPSHIITKQAPSLRYEKDQSGGRHLLYIDGVDDCTVGWAGDAFFDIPESSTEDLYFIQKISDTSILSSSNPVPLPTYLITNTERVANGSDILWSRKTGRISTDSVGKLLDMRLDQELEIRPSGTTTLLTFEDYDQRVIRLYIAGGIIQRTLIDGVYQD